MPTDAQFNALRQDVDFLYRLFSKNPPSVPLPLSVANLKVTTADPNSPFVRLTAPAGVAKEIQLGDSDLISGRRWQMISDATAESGSNAGSDFYISSFDDTGLNGTDNIKIERKTGIVTIYGPIQLGISYTVATLPAGAQGMLAYVTDLLAPTYLAAAVGGGVIVGPVFRNATTWVSI